MRFRFLWFSLVLFLFLTTMSTAAAAVAVPISLGTPVTDNLATSTTENLYEFTLTSAGDVSLNFQHAVVSASYDYWYVKI